MGPIFNTWSTWELKICRYSEGVMDGAQEKSLGAYAGMECCVFLVIWCRASSPRVDNYVYNG